MDTEAKNGFITELEKVIEVQSSANFEDMKNNKVGDGKVEEEEPEKMFFLIKWKGTEETDFVNAKEAKLKIPQIVIEFYEEKLNWFKDDAEDSQDEE